MDKLKTIVADAMKKLEGTISAEQVDAVSQAIEAATIRGLLEGQHRAVDVCMAKSEAEQDLAHKIAGSIRRKNDALIVNLSSLR